MLSIMLIVHILEWFFGGAFLANAVPHFGNGVSGRPFQSPFSKPPGQVLSSSMVNVAWGFFNLVVAYLLIVWVGDFSLRNVGQIVAAGAGAFVMSLNLAWA